MPLVISFWLAADKLCVFNQHVAKRCCNYTAWQHGSVAAWQHGSMAAWQHGSVAAWQRGSTAAWQHGSMAARQHGSTAARQHGSMAARQHGSTAAWQHGSTAAWQHGSMAAWQHGSMAAWQPLQGLFLCQLVSLCWKERRENMNVDSFLVKNIDVLSSGRKRCWWQNSSLGCFKTRYSWDRTFHLQALTKPAQTLTMVDGANRLFTSKQKAKNSKMLGEMQELSSGREMNNLSRLL